MVAHLLGQETQLPDGGHLTYRVVVGARLVQGTYTVTGVVPTFDTQMPARLEVTLR